MMGLALPTKPGLVELASGSGTNTLIITGLDFSKYPVMQLLGRWSPTGTNTLSATFLKDGTPCSGGNSAVSASASVGGPYLCEFGMTPAKNGVIDFRGLFGGTLFHDMGDAGGVDIPNQIRMQFSVAGTIKYALYSVAGKITFA